jgi:hypothetical protein
VLLADGRDPHKPTAECGRPPISVKAQDKKVAAALGAIGCESPDDRLAAGATRPVTSPKVPTGDSFF